MSSRARQLASSRAREVLSRETVPWRYRGPLPACHPLQASGVWDHKGDDLTPTLTLTRTRTRTLTLTR